MAFVHVIAADVVVPKLRQNPNAADTQNHLLAKPVVGVTAIEVIGECPVPSRVLCDGSLNHIYRQHFAGDPLK
jgi:hypothetical protein